MRFKTTLDVAIFFLGIFAVSLGLSRGFLDFSLIFGGLTILSFAVCETPHEERLDT
jgi:hypothetical protein